MGKKADVIEIASVDNLCDYLGAKHAAYVEIDDATYYLTDVNEHYWRAQYTDQLNDKGHYIDASELVPTVSEFVNLPFADGKTLADVIGSATFFASEK